MKNKAYLNWILLLVSIFTYGQEVKTTLFENEKLKISFHKGAIEQKFYHQKNDVGVFDTISIRLFPDQKTYIGKETNKNLNFKYLEKKYLKKAIDLESKKSHDINSDIGNFKIVRKVINNDVYFYYYFSKIYSNRVVNFRKSKNEKDYDSWMYYGNETFWFEFAVNGKVVAWKKYGFQ